MNDYPEHEKLSRTMKLSEFTQMLGEQISSDNPDRKFYLCEKRADACYWCGGSGYSNRCGRCEQNRFDHRPIQDPHGFVEKECSDCSGTGNSRDETYLQPVSDINHVLGELFGVDHNKLMSEKDQMLKEIRKAKEEIREANQK